MLRLSQVKFQESLLQVKYNRIFGDENNTNHKKQLEFYLKEDPFNKIRITTETKFSEMDIAMHEICLSNITRIVAKMN